MDYDHLPAMTSERWDQFFGVRRFAPMPDIDDRIAVLNRFFQLVEEVAA